MNSIRIRIWVTPIYSKEYCVVGYRVAREVPVGPNGEKTRTDFLLVNPRRMRDKKRVSRWKSPFRPKLSTFPSREEADKAARLALARLQKSLEV